MTRGGLEMEQKAVDTFIDNLNPSGEDLENGIDISDLSGKPNERLSLRDILHFASRGICLRLQARERKTETIKMSDLKDAVAAGDPIALLRSRSYSDKTIYKIFTTK